jgi:poly(A) polymerase
VGKLWGSTPQGRGRLCPEGFRFLAGYVMVMDVEPRIIPRKEHRISRKHVSQNAVRTLYRLHRNGFIAYLVGGCVRDLLLGRTPKDFDIATNATPGQIKRLFRNCRLIGRRFRLAHLHFDNEILEVCTFRRAGVPEDNIEPQEQDRPRRFPRHIQNEEGMILVDNVFGTPEEDALRRDFTINALAYNIADFSVIDFSTGLNDLKERLIRLIGDPRVRFTEDPVRMLRAVRFAARLDFVIETVAWEALCELSSTASRASPARLYEEIQKLFLMGSARPAFLLLEKSGLLAALFPGLSQWIQEKNDRSARVTANLDAVDRLHGSDTPPTAPLLMAALFGQAIEEAALALHREGIPYHQALDATCATFMKELCLAVSVPGKVTGRFRAMLALQPSLHRMPPRRPAATAGKPEFGDALAYLRMTAAMAKEYQAVVEWWEDFLVNGPPIVPEEPEPEEAPKKKRRRRRRKGRRIKKAAEKPTGDGTE